MRETVASLGFAAFSESEYGRVAAYFIALCRD
jgi:hypothetical protein